jgi:hypothetical protein
VASGALLVWAAGQPHTTAAASENESRPSVVQDTLAKLQAGDQSGATARIKDLETAWDDDRSTLQPLDDTGWTVLDGQIHSALTALRTSQPDLATEKPALTTLLTSLQ